VNHPTPYPMGTGGSFMGGGVKWQGREADHSPTSIVEVKNAWSYTSTFHYIFIKWYLIKHKDNFAPANSLRVRCTFRVINELL
jgi:hypothetical protein